MAAELPRRPRPRCGRALARRTDRIEDLVAWLLVSAGLLAAFGAVLIGHVAYDGVRNGEGGRAVPVRAVLLAAAPARPAPVPAAWTGADGTEQTTEVVVPAGLPAGAEVPAWVDRTTHLAVRPPSAAEAAALGAGAGLAVLAVVTAVLAAAWGAVRRATGRRNAAAWAREWARVEPLWSRRVP